MIDRNVTSNLYGLACRCASITNLECAARDALCTGATLDGSLVPAASGVGSNPIVPLATALQRIGGRVDLLKMDCEGAEWDILRDQTSLQKARMTAMEYHLFGGPERTLLNLLHRLQTAGFRIEALREAANPLVGQLFAVNTTGS